MTESTSYSMVIFKSVTDALTLIEGFAIGEIRFCKYSRLELRSVFDSLSGLLIKSSLTSPLTMLKQPSVFNGCRAMGKRFSDAGLKDLVLLLAELLCPMEAMLLRGGF